jgi:putative NADPH-quinone reductase
MRPGVAYAFEEGDQGEGMPVGLLRARTAVVLNTSNTPADREREAFGDTLESIWKRCVFELCGVKDVRRRDVRCRGDEHSGTPEALASRRRGAGSLGLSARRLE